MVCQGTNTYLKLSSNYMRQPGNTFHKGFQNIGYTRCVFLNELLFIPRLISYFSGLTDSQIDDIRKLYGIYSLYTFTHVHKRIEFILHLYIRNRIQQL